MEVRYDPFNGLVIPDGQIQQWADQVQNNPVVTIGSETMMNELRARHREKRLHITAVKYWTEGHFISLEIDTDGRINEWPDGFCDHNDKALERLLVGIKW